MRFLQYKAFDASSVATDLYSDPIDVSYAVTSSVQVHLASGTATGKCFIQVSLDPINTDPTNWVEIGSGADLTGSATTAYERLEICANWIRLHWDHSSGTGTIDAHIKTIGF